MKYLLGPRGAAVLVTLARSPVLLAFDFDGTLAPIVLRRAQARMPARTSDLFRRLCGLYPCAVISGRARADVAARLGAAAVRYVVGNHGLEAGGARPALAADVAKVRDRLRSALTGIPGIDLEDKRYSLSLHYRRARNKQRARAGIRRALSTLPRGMRVVSGKQIFNVVPTRGGDKGKAVVSLLSREGAARALYVGDDVTDEDVFALPSWMGVVGVRVGRARHSAAAYFLRNRGDVDRLIAQLLALRAAPEAP